jgi:hypothetical protein
MAPSMRKKDSVAGPVASATAVVMADRVADLSCGPQQQWDDDDARGADTGTRRRRSIPMFCVCEVFDERAREMAKNVV